MRFTSGETTPRQGRRSYFFLALLVCGLLPVLWARAQDPASDPATNNAAPMNVEAPNNVPSSNAAAAPATANNAGPNSSLPSVWDLAMQGGIFMIPIGLCSLVVVAYGIERFVALRTKNIAPAALVAELYALSTEEKGIDPRQAFEICKQHPSPLARIIEAAILKVGRPHSELEQAVEDAAAREADEMARNLKPINTAAVLGPQLGLIGTVQGMILAFMVTSTTTATGAAKGQELAAGIYTALVTTFAGLCVSIPAVIVATMIESRIERLLRGMEDVFNHVLPQFERFEGKYRASLTSDASAVVLKATAQKPAPTRTASEGTSSAVIASATTSGPSSPKGLWGVMGSKSE